MENDSQSKLRSGSVGCKKCEIQGQCRDCQKLEELMFDLDWESVHDETR